MLHADLQTFANFNQALHTIHQRGCGGRHALGWSRAVHGGFVVTAVILPDTSAWTLHSALGFPQGMGSERKTLKRKTILGKSRSLRIALRTLTYRGNGASPTSPPPDRASSRAARPCAAPSALHFPSDSLSFFSLSLACFGCCCRSSRWRSSHPVRARAFPLVARVRPLQRRAVCV